MSASAVLFFCVCVCVGGGFTYISGLSFEIDITSELKKIMEHLSKRNQDGMGSSSGEHAVSTQQKRESTRLLEEPFEAKLCVAFTPVKISSNRKNCKRVEHMCVADNALSTAVALLWARNCVTFHHIHTRHAIQGMLCY